MPEQSEFAQAVERGLEDLEHVSTGLCSGCKECRSGYGYPTEESMELAINNGLHDEGGFSWHYCSCCGSPFGGNRYVMHGIDKEDDSEDILHFEVCEDCLVYLANGDEPKGWEG